MIKTIPEGGKSHHEAKGTRFGNLFGLPVGATDRSDWMKFTSRLVEQWRDDDEETTCSYLREEKKKKRKEVLNPAPSGFDGTSVIGCRSTPSPIGR